MRGQRSWETQLGLSAWFQAASLQSCSSRADMGCEGCFLDARRSNRSSGVGERPSPVCSSLPLLQRTPAMSG